MDDFFCKNFFKNAKNLIFEKFYAIYKLFENNKLFRVETFVYL